MGNEVYCYQKMENGEYESKHKSMHTLCDTFVQADTEQIFMFEDESTTFFPFKLVFPINKVRIYYCKTKQERADWVSRLKENIGQKNINDFYIFKHDLGKGKFGQVKLAINRETNEKVAIKVIKKKDVPT